MYLRNIRTRRKEHTHTAKEKRERKKKTHRPNKTKSEEWAHENKRFELEHAKRENEKKIIMKKKNKTTDFVGYYSCVLVMFVSI